MIRFIAILLLAVSCVSAQAQTLVVTKTGYHLLTQDANGNPFLTKITQVVTLGEPTNPPPPVDPPPLGLEAHRGRVKTATDQVTDPNKANTKKALAELYRATASLPVQDRNQLVQATDVMFRALGIPLWAPWKAAVDQSVAGFIALDDAKKAWQIIAEVLELP